MVARAYQAAKNGFVVDALLMTATRACKNGWLE